MSTDPPPRIGNIGDLDIAGCGCFAFASICVICATIIALVLLERL